MGAHCRLPFAYVVGVDGVTVTLNLRDSHRGRLGVVPGGVTPVLQVGAWFGIRHASQVLVAEVAKLHFAESREAHREGVGTTVSGDEPLRQIKARILGRLVCGSEFQTGCTVNQKRVIFVRGGLASPALGAEAFPLSPEELAAVASYSGPDSVEVGRILEPPMTVRVQLDDLLARHVVVTGSTGQGKSCLTAAILQQLLNKHKKMRCVVFDVNGEYRRAFCKLPPDDPDDESRWIEMDGVKVTQIGPQREASGVQRYQIPYYALGRNGLEALLQPSDRAQRPALRFAISALPYVEWKADGAALAGDAATMFDDCRNGGEKEAADSIRRLRERILKGTDRARTWPPLKVLAPIVAEFAALQPDSKAGNGFRRDSFHYGHVSSLIRRIHAACEDGGFTKVVNVEGGGMIPLSNDPIKDAAREILDTIFGIGIDGITGDWKLHIVDLRLVPHDVLPFLMGAMLHALIDDTFQKGPGRTFPMLLVLEEAHHYLRGASVSEGDPSLRELLAYERLAKEGRKFGVALWLSTQRPSELSQTVLSQCGTWFCLRLTARSDLEHVRHALEWADATMIERIAGLPRQEAIAFGAAFPVPVHIRLSEASPVPQSKDPKFYTAWNDSFDGSIMR